jgi:hypothetical protein
MGVRRDKAALSSGCKSHPAKRFRQHARLVEQRVGMIGLEQRAYGAHSLRRTTVALVYKKTGNLRAGQLLLGHRKLESTVRYLGIAVGTAPPLRGVRRPSSRRGSFDLMVTRSHKLHLSAPVGVELKQEFRDADERRAYLRAYLLAQRLVENPALLARGRAFLDRFVKKDPRQRQIYAMWSDALTLPVNKLVTALLADDARGAALRETAPVFVVIPAAEIRALEKSAA